MAVLPWKIICMSYHDVMASEIKLVSSHGEKTGVTRQMSSVSQSMDWMDKKNKKLVVRISDYFFFDPKAETRQAPDLHSKVKSLRHSELCSVRAWLE